MVGGTVFHKHNFLFSKLSDMIDMQQGRLDWHVYRVGLHVYMVLVHNYSLPVW